MSREGQQNTNRRAMLATGRGVIKLVYDALKMQAAQVVLFAGEVRDNVERMQQYGFTSVPLPGAEAAVISLGGNRDHTIIIAVDDRRYRLKNLQGGEVALYTDEGDSVILRRGNKVQINTKTLEINAQTAVNISAPTVAITGNLTATGNITDTSGGAGKSMASMRGTFNSHTHTENNNAGGPTGTPSQQM